MNPRRRDRCRADRHLSRGTAPHVPQRRRDRDVLGAERVTDGDSLVHFRRADVIVAGNVFTTTRFPFIDVANGGTVDGEIKSAERHSGQDRVRRQGHGGTIVMPGHGYLWDEHEVVEYRDMVVIVRDRSGRSVAPEPRSIRSWRPVPPPITTRDTAPRRGLDDRHVRRGRSQDRTHK